MNWPLVVGIIVVIVGIILLMLIRIFLYGSIYKQYKKLRDPVYLKKEVYNQKWMGKPVTSGLIKKMSALTLISAGIFFLLSLYVLIDMGPNQLWAMLFALGIILAYASSLWINYTRRQNRVKANRSNLEFTSVYSQIFMLIFIGVAIFVSLFREISMRAPYAQIWMISLALFIVIGNEIHYRKTIS